MRTFRKLTVSLFALALVAGLSGSAFAADAGKKESKEKGSVKGTVTGADGKPAADLAVRLQAPAGERRAAPGKQAEADAPAAGTALVAAADKPKAAGKKPARGGNAALQTTKTDAKGEFAFEGVEPGTYRVVAGDRTTGTGRAEVTVKAGEAATASISLKAVKGK